MTKRKKTKDLSQHQRAVLAQIKASPAEYVIGIDEVGVGCWAGPIAVGGVVLQKGWAHPAVVDSKSFKQNRKKMAKVLLEVVYPAALNRCLMSHPADVIDVMGVEASRQHLTEAAGIWLREKYPNSIIVMDGLEPIPIDGSLKGVVAMPGADAHVTAVSAASILAKVSRDLYMMQQHELYPEYGFDTNVGYHSLKHKYALKELGPTPLHRRSFRPVQSIIRERKMISSSPSVPLTAKLWELVNS